ncbi:MarR family transcriptional regulator [Spirilliplanes yamanashiensis]|uniref:MarR family transcriptional regulator n=2 Tax=Spirilliplanes yamanashiensis TaxID=42233 RepID=A0A8J4DKH7_9ACTN|nr:MarR family transcriptional regulator [Spirilliplanes yamanashiensis]
MALTTMIMTLPGAIDAQLKRDSGINFFEYSILVMLDRSPGRAVQMSVLALYAGGSPSRLSHAVSRLERHGWVGRRHGENRCVEAVLTDAGAAALVAAAPGHVREARRLVVDAVDPAQIGTLEHLCRQIVQAAAPETGARLEENLAKGDGAPPDTPC